MIDSDREFDRIVAKGGRRARGCEGGRAREGGRGGRARGRWTRDSGLGTRDSGLGTRERLRASSSSVQADRDYRSNQPASLRATCFGPDTAHGP